MDTQDREIKPVKESEVTAVKPPRKKNLFSILIVVLIGALILAIPFVKAIQPWTYFNRGNDYYSKGDLDRAIADYDKAIQLNPDYTLAYYNRGVAYTAKGDKQSASADFKKVLELCGNSTLCQQAQQELDKLGLK